MQGEFGDSAVAVVGAEQEFAIGRGRQMAGGSALSGHDVEQGQRLITVDLERGRRSLAANGADCIQEFPVRRKRDIAGVFNGCKAQLLNHAVVIIGVPVNAALWSSSAGDEVKKISRHD